MCSFNFSEEEIEEIEYGLNADQIEVVTDILNQINLNDDSYQIDFDVNKTLTLDVTENQCSFMELESETSRIEPKIDSTYEGNLLEIQSRLETGFQSIFENRPTFETIEAQRFIISVEKLKQLHGKFCGEMVGDSLCNETVTFEIDTKGSILTMRWSCPKKHFGNWVSDDVLCTKKSAKVFALDVLISAAIMFSGNNYIKIKLFTDFLNINIISQNTFHRIQKLYCTPTLNEYWIEMKETISNVYKDYSNICLCGDGRNDSPGHSAR